jgi:anti-anti-sigma factor
MATKWSDDIVLVELADEPLLSEELASVIHGVETPRKKTSHIVLNFGGVSYVNSSNLGQVLKLRRHLVERKRSLTLCSVNEEVYSIFRVTGLDKVFRFAPDPLTALATLQMQAEA